MSIEKATPKGKGYMLKHIVDTGAVIVAAIGAAGLAAGYIGAIDALHLNPAAPGDRKKVACVGDSITYGCFVAGQPWNSYPRQLGKLLGDDYYVANFGYTNRTATKSADHPYTSEKLYTKSLEFRPDIVLIMLGTNDTKAHNWDPAAYRRDMTDIINSYLEIDSHPEVIILLPPPVFTIHRRVMWQIRGDILAHEVIPALRKIAGEKGLRVIDTNGPFMLKRRLFVDGVHPNAEGAKLLARTVFEDFKNIED